MRSRMMKMDWPTIGFAPGENSVARTRMAARVAEEGVGVFAAGEAAVGAEGPDVEATGTDCTAWAGGGVRGVLAAIEVEELADAGVRVATLHCWERGVKVTLSPFMSETRRPLTVVVPSCGGCCRGRRRR